MGRFDIRTLYQPTVLMTLALMAIIIMMILPVPAFVLDLGLAASFGLAILIFANTLFISRPLDFSAFPTILLASLMLRLSLNVSSTKLIIGQGHTGTHAAGGVIEGFAMFVMGGSVFLGLVVFGVLLIVNFIVITKGAGRMAEVGARFALDAMPGKQLAIDSDMAAGAMAHDEAKERRRIEQEETTFFGSLDGASKFVKGDAIAGLLITLLNLVVGLSIGMFAQGMPAGLAFETYAILTVGDGLVSQIPAVIISIATALLLAKGGATDAADKAVLSQLGEHPMALATVAALMLVFAVVPGLPFLPFVIGAIGLGATAFYGFKRQAALETLEPAGAGAEAGTVSTVPVRGIGDILDLDEIHVTVAPDLVTTAMNPASGLDTRIVNMRNHIAELYGLILPEIRLTDDPASAPGEYSVRIQGVEVARDRIDPKALLMLLPDRAADAPEGRDVLEPVYGAPARWIMPEQRGEAERAGLTIVTPTEVIATHLLELLKGQFARLFTRRALRKLLDAFVTVSDADRAAANKRLLDEYLPDPVPLDTLQTVLRLLLDEQISIRNLPLILEALAEAGPKSTPPDILTEHVRRRLAFQLTAPLLEADGALPLIQLDMGWEALFARYESEDAETVALPPAEINRLADGVAEQSRKFAEVGRNPAIILPARRRRFVRSILSARGIRNPVLSYDEIDREVRPAMLGSVPA
ncbi:flagellar biosynthesis protein FlhA [Roseobacter sp. HKCCA0434]|uniref:flagellar biosynthesis protein FlhA n=1 Tax=Roseobacter sp. HKCCA0434 TaxID=3079297 RepID=UPI00290580A2|nr:flagellar biosynthesis protein FlhA [Roseobacter sp. HKCCA0434]